jgi:hypothetical protein
MNQNISNPASRDLMRQGAHWAARAVRNVIRGTGPLFDVVSENLQSRNIGFIIPEGVSVDAHRTAEAVPAGSLAATIGNAANDLQLISHQLSLSAEVKISTGHDFR